MYMHLCIAGQAYDQCQSSKATYMVHIVASAALGQEVQKAMKAAEDVWKLKETTEFENWIVRILLGGSGTKAKHPEKAITNKHTRYVTTEMKNNPVKQVHSALWQLAKPRIGATA